MKDMIVAVKKAVWRVLTVAMCCAGLPCLAQNNADCSAYPQLNSYERSQFLSAFYSRRAEVFVQLLASPGCESIMLDELRKLGGGVRYSDAKSGYALALIPREKLLDALDLPGAEYAYTRDDDRMYLRDPIAEISQSERRPEAVTLIAIPYPRVATKVAKDGPYFAADETGLVELWRQHPEADGRGVRVAVPDEGFDLLHPALQEARDARGNIVPKIADLGTLTTPEEDSRWVSFGPPIQAENGSFEAAGRTWTAPDSGAYRFGIFKTDLELGPEDNSQAKKLSLSVGVIWDERGNRVWVDTDGDHSFKNQCALGDYGATHDVDWFGTKDGANDNRIPFGVKIRAAQNAVYIRIGGEHGAYVGGALAGNRMTGGLFDGTAPSAQLIDENLGGVTLIASIVRMFARPDVDVINRSGSLGPAGYGRNREGVGDFTRHVVERAIRVYGKPIAAFSAAVGTIDVNDYAGPEMLRRNRQLADPYRDTVTGFVGFLPNGSINTVLAPSANLDTDSRYMADSLPGEDGIRRGFRDEVREPSAPDGYTIGANPSPAIPVVSGVLADLISEAKREHVRYNVLRLNNAVFTGAQLLGGLPLSQQGYGLINAARSWDQLARMATADDPRNPELTSFTLARMERGKPIDVQGFHADLPQAGEPLDGEILLTRHGGYSAGRKYNLSLRGNDGSFTLPDQTATFDLDKPTRVRFSTNGASGWHVAFLELRDAAADVVMQDVPLSVRAPDAPQALAAGIERYESTIEPLRSETRFVRVGEEVQAVRYVMRIPYTGPENISTRSFPGGRYRSTKTPAGEPVDAAHHVGPMETLESLVANDEPGTQDVFWENRGRPEYATRYDGPAPDVPIHAELTVSKYAVEIQTKANDALTITNKLAQVEGKVELYDAALKTSHLTGAGLHASGEAERTLPAGLTQWRVQVRSDSASSEPADVYLLNCSGKNGCVVAAHQEISVAGRTVAVDKPQAGDWKIVVRSRGQVSRPVNYEVHEALLTSTGTPIESADAKHASGATWSLPLPAKRSDAQYAGFRIAGTPGNEKEKNGLLIAMTPLDSKAP